MAKIRQSNLDNSIVTGLGELSNVASGDQTIIYDASTGTLKKISQINLLNFPVVSSVSPTSATSGDGIGNYTFTITGKGFTGASASLINNSGTTINFDTVTVDSNTQITGVIAKSSLPSSGEPYDVRVTAASGLISTLENQINVDQSPIFNTASGSLGTVLSQLIGSTTLTVEAYDPDSAGNVTFEIQSGSLPAGASITTVHENGVSKANISGFSAVVSNTTSNFVLRAVDAASNTSSRSFSITVNAAVSESFTSSGTFSVPSGISTVDVLVVAGGGAGSVQHSGGGGAGGLIFMPGYPVTPGGTVTVTVGCGGTGQPSSSNASVTPGQTGQDSVFGTLTAKGGGGGGNHCGGVAQSGGSGGGGGASSPDPTPEAGGAATQPTQPGNSGAYGFGNPGGASANPRQGPVYAGGGGGGAGAAGDNGSNSPGGPLGYGGQGGAGKAYTIADGTTPVYYAGGGGGGTHGVGCNPTCRAGGLGGQGGGGDANVHKAAPACIPAALQTGQPGQANKGGGGGSNASFATAPGPSGGKGIVIVRY